MAELIQAARLFAFQLWNALMSQAASSQKNTCFQEIPAVSKTFFPLPTNLLA